MAIPDVRWFTPDFKEQHAVDRSKTSIRHDGVIISWCGKEFNNQTCSITFGKEIVCKDCLHTIQDFDQATDTELNKMKGIENA